MPRIPRTPLPMVPLPERAAGVVAKLIHQVKALRLAAAKLAPASSTDSTSFGLQCLMSPTATGTWRFRTQAFGEVELLAGVCDRHGRPLLGSPDEGKEPGAPRSLPRCSTQLKALLRRVALEMHRVLQTRAGEVWDLSNQQFLDEVGGCTETGPTSCS
ncbi:hypothetical protein AK812_SmicGene20245 [Symbiodinium microadriaticum]|uniref:Uncharacterized protein n=1 Tax=Symbiodinium microadriaticum TaxID=2951 RepID=A0A1Q9DQF8_SYMMI|nr:hypothetical protein AK812_SmicGene20245 [Symbiodinium microadriaticum]